MVVVCVQSNDAARFGEHTPRHVYGTCTEGVGNVLRVRLRSSILCAEPSLDRPERVLVGVGALTPSIFPTKPDLG